MPFPLPDSIVTERLMLRAPRPEDADTIFEAWSQDADVTRFLVWRPLKSVDITRGFIASCIENWNTGVAFSYVVTTKDTDEVVGMLAARPKAHLVNIGYVLRRTHWGRGLMPEAVTAFTRIALAHPTLFRVEATCAVENLASARTLEKSGFVREGRLARHTVHPNISAEPGDCWLYAVTR